MPQVETVNHRVRKFVAASHRNQTDDQIGAGAILRQGACILNKGDYLPVYLLHAAERIAAHSGRRFCAFAPRHTDFFSYPDRHSQMSPANCARRFDESQSSPLSTRVAIKRPSPSIRISGERCVSTRTRPGSAIAIPARRQGLR